MAGWRAHLPVGFHPFAVVVFAVIYSRGPGGGPW